MTRRLTLPDSKTLDGAKSARRSAPSAQRNESAILAVLSRLAPAQGRVLELASGTGQHAAAFTAALPGLTWQPTDANPEAIASITAWVTQSGHPNLLPPVLLDASQPGWASHHPDYDLTLVVNLLHLISAPEACAVITGMAQALRPGGQALIYGPFKRDGQLTSPGDQAFDASLRTQDPAIGYKDVSWVTTQAATAGLIVREEIEMPANNLMLALQRHV